MAALTLADVKVRFRERFVLDGVDLVVEPGEVVSIIGKSGQGKTTLLEIAAGLLMPTSGTVLAPVRGRIGYVFQRPELLPWLTVIDNAALPLVIGGASRKAARSVVSQILADLGLAGALDKTPEQISGGMSLRCSLARAISTQPDLLLLDEPFVALDEITRRMALTTANSVIRDQSIATVLVSHSVQEAVYLADKVYVLAQSGRLTAPIDTGTIRSANPITRLESSELAACCAKVVSALEAASR